MITPMRGVYEAIPPPRPGLQADSTYLAPLPWTGSRSWLPTGSRSAAALILCGTSFSRYSYASYCAAASPSSARSAWSFLRAKQPASEGRMHACQVREAHQQQPARWQQWRRPHLQMAVKATMLSTAGSNRRRRRANSGSRGPQHAWRPRAAGTLQRRAPAKSRSSSWFAACAPCSGIEGAMLTIPLCSLDSLPRRPAAAGQHEV